MLFAGKEDVGSKKTGSKKTTKELLNQSLSDAKTNLISI